MSSPFRWTAGVERRVLSNGLTVLVQPDPAAPAVAVVTHVKAGFFDEPDHWQGISHVLEHMFFKGTPTRPVGRIASETKALGGYLNASTGYDATSYYMVLPAEGFGQALAIQADALRHATIDADELQRELRVIIEEAKRKLDSPSAVAYETLHELLFDRHRIRRWRIGTEAMLAGFTRDDVVGYYRSRYVPERVIVSIVGAVDPAAAFSAARAAFEDWPARPPALDPSPAEPWRHEVRARTLRGDVQQAELAIGWRGVPPMHPDSATLDLVAMVLGSGRGSRLYRGLRQPGIVTSIGAYHYSPSEVGVFAIAADCDPGRVAAALQGVARTVATLRAEAPSAAELARARTLLTAKWARRFESVEGRAAAFAAAEGFGGVDIIEREYAALSTVTPEAVRRAAERYLVPEAAAAVAYLPRGGGPDVNADVVREAFELEAAPSAPSSPSPTAGTAPGLAGSAPVTTSDVQHVVLPGFDLLVRRKPGVPLVSIGVYRRRRTVEDRLIAGLGALAVRSAGRGAGRWSADELADGFEGQGGSLAPSVAADWFGFGASVLREHLGRAATLLHAVLREPRFDQPEVERERATLADEVARGTDDMFRYPVELALAAAFGDHRYGHPVKGWPESVRGLEVAQVAAWHRDELAGGRTTVVAVGDLDPSQAIEVLAGVFDGGAASVEDGTELPPPPPIRPNRRVEERTKAQTALAMVFPGPGRAAPDRHAAMVLAAVASGLGGRMFHALRDRRSLAYTVLMSSWQRRSAGALITYIATSPEREAEAREAMLEEAVRFGREPISADELKQAVNYLAGQAQVQRQTAGALAGEILDAFLLGTGLEELQDPAAPFRAVTREAVLEVAARSLEPSVRAEGVVRGVSAEPGGHR